MSDLLFSDAERNRFRVWLERASESAEGMAKQMEQSFPSDPVMAALIKKERMRAAAYRIVANELASMESQTIGGGAP